MKRFFSLLLTSVLCVTCSAALIGCKSDDTSSPDQSSSIVDTPVEEPTIVQLTPADTQISENLEKISLYDLKTAEDSYAKLLFKDVSVGNVIKTFLDANFVIGGEPVITVNRYSDGSWRSLENGVNKFDDVTNAIFNYELFSGSGLGLNKAQLDVYGNKKVVDLSLTALFGQKISVEGLLGGQSGGMVPSVNTTDYEDTLAILKPVLYITVAELDDLSLNGPTALITKFGNVAAADYIGACCEIIKAFATDETEVRDRVLVEIKAQAHELYEEVAIKDIVAATAALEIDDMIGSINSVILEAGVSAPLSNAVTHLFETIFDGTVGAPEFDDTITIQMLISGVQDISDSLFKRELLDKVYGNLLKLYGTEALAKDFVGATMALEIHDVLDAVADVLIVVANGNAAEAVKEVVAYVKTLVSGTIGDPVFASETVTTNEVIAAIKEKTGKYVTNDALTEAYARLTSLYEGKLFKDFAADTKALDADDVIEAIGSVIKAAKIIDDAKTDAILAFVGTLLSIDLETSESAMTVSDLAESVKALIDVFVAENAAFDEIYADIVALYGDTLLADFAQATKALKIDEIIDVIEKIVKATNSGDDNAVTVAIELLKPVLAGTVFAPTVNTDVSVSALISGVASLINSTGCEVPESLVIALTSFFGDATLANVDVKVKSKTLGEADRDLFDGAIFGDGYEELKEVTVGEFIEYLNGGENEAFDELLKSLNFGEIIDAFGGGAEEKLADAA